MEVLRGWTMISEIDLHWQLMHLFASKMNLTVASIDTDLIGSGLLDSLKLIDLLLQLEQEYGVEISLDDLEVDNFRSIASIAAFVARRDGDFKETILERES
jgi:methoxymalonate biosynthesis acyl carrier protein